MPFITRDKTNFKYILIVAILVVIVGGIIAYQYWWLEKLERLKYETDSQEKTNEQQKDEQDLQDTETDKLKNEAESTKEQQENSFTTKGTALTNLEILGIAGTVKPAIVYIETLYGSGSGMIVGEDGYVLTNAHIVKNTGVIKIYLFDGRKFNALALAVDEQRDTAVIKINADNLPMVKFGDPSKTQQGNAIVALGYPDLNGDINYKAGTVVRKLIKDGVSYLEISAGIDPGNSGGPLVNRSGEVIGINTGKFGISISGKILGDTIKYATPISSNLITYLKATTKDFSGFADCSLIKARGFIDISNSYSAPQKITASTELVSTSGFVFKTDEDILIPALERVTVSVTAAKIGQIYAIGPTNFSFPIFVGTAKYTKIYGISHNPMSCR